MPSGKQLIKRLIKQTGSDRRQLAKTMRVDPVTIWRWENGLSPLQGTARTLVLMMLERGAK